MHYIENFISTHRLQPADAVVLKLKLFGMVDHYAIYLGYDRWNYPIILANYSKGTRRLSKSELDSFLKILDPQRIVRFQGSSRERRWAVDRALSKIGEENYNYWDNNCEHYANYVQHGVSRSIQVEAFRETMSAVVPVALGVLLLTALFSEE